MTYRETCILLPCHSLEDFPMHYEGVEADGLLSAWTSLWHPLLLATTGAMPTWCRSDSPPEDFPGRLIVVPSVSQQELPAGYAERAEADGACLIVGDLPRQVILRQAMQPLTPPAKPLHADLVADFLALGYCYLQVELLTRQMRYSTNLDEIHFNRQVTAAAEATVAGDQQQAQEQLTACYDLLAEERDHYYAVDAYVLDLTLLAETTLGESLRQQVELGLPVNLMLPAELLDQLQRTAPESYQAIRTGLAEGYVALVGGPDSRSRPTLEAAETIRHRLDHNAEQFQQVLGTQPRVFGTRQFGISPIHPQLLHQLGYVGAFHVSLSDGHIPEGSQIKVRWEGPDHSSLDAIAKNLQDGSQPGTYLGLASRLGETMDMDHVATVCLVHWPGHVSPWYHDLRRAARYGAMLGRFITVDEYFRETDYPGQLEQFAADQYRSPYLDQAVARQDQDPISSWVQYWRNRAIMDATKTLSTISALLGSSQTGSWNSLVDQVDVTAQTARRHELTDQLTDRLQQAAQQLGEQLPRTAPNARPAYLVVNPTCAPRRIQLDLPQLDQLPLDDPSVYAAAAQGEHKYVVMDLPPLGFAYIDGTAPEMRSSTTPGRSTNVPAWKRLLSRTKPKSSRKARSSRRSTQLLAEENRLINDYCEVHLSPETGAIQSLFQHNKRGNCLSQQLAIRNPRQAGATASGQSPIYTEMAADRLEITAATTTFGEITSEGRLLDAHHQILAHFRQRYQIWRGSRVLRLLIELDPQAQLGANPWDSYYACRFAWASESSLLWRGVSQLRERAEATRIEAPNYIEIDDAGTCTTILTGGLPYHRRTGRRMLDSLLMVRGEHATQFECGIGIDLKYPLQEAMNFLTPVPVLPDTKGAPQGNVASWLFHLECRNVLATDWSPLVEDGQLAGVRVRLLETAGRPAKGRLRGFRAFHSARRLDFCNESLGACAVREGGVVLEIGAHEWTQLEARWSPE